MEVDILTGVGGMIAALSGVVVFYRARNLWAASWAFATFLWCIAFLVK